MKKFLGTFALLLIFFACDHIVATKSKDVKNDPNSASNTDKGTADSTKASVDKNSGVLTAYLADTPVKQKKLPKLKNCELPVHSTPPEPNEPPPLPVQPVYKAVGMNDAREQSMKPKADGLREPDPVDKQGTQPPNPGTGEPVDPGMIDKGDTRCADDVVAFETVASSVKPDEAKLSDPQVKGMPAKTEPAIYRCDRDDSGYQEPYDGQMPPFMKPHYCGAVDRRLLALCGLASDKITVKDLTKKGMPEKIADMCIFITCDFIPDGIETPPLPVSSSAESDKDIPVLLVKHKKVAGSWKCSVEPSPGSGGGFEPGSSGSGGSTSGSAGSGTQGSGTGTGTVNPENPAGVLPGGGKDDPTATKQ